MIIEIFKPNKNVTGHAFFMELMPDLKKDKEGLELTSLFFRFVKQSGWDEKSSTGSFGSSFKKDGKDARIKLSEFEAGSIIRFLSNGKDWSTVHKSPHNKNTTQIKATTFTAGSGNYARTCYSISIIQNGSDKYGISLEMGEGECLKKALETYLVQRYAKKTQFQLNYMKNKNGN